MILDNNSSNHKNKIKSAIKNILVAEDEEVNFFLLDTILSSYNFKTIHARNGQEALDYFQTIKDISLILMDINMPVMDGLDAIIEIRKLDEEIPIIVQTAYALKSIKEKALKAGCSDFISKPINSQLLINKIDRHL